jgi:hypothetical protein
VKHHPVFDFLKWSEDFTLDPVDEAEAEELPVPSGPDDIWNFALPVDPEVHNPVELCYFELLRRQALLRYDLGRSVAVDVFVWRAGPPERPYLTKIGGVPHRPASWPWPVAGDGTPLTFVAQMCFLDSRDIVSEKVPGDVILIFMKPPESWTARDKNIVIEWGEPQLDQPVTIEECPPAEFYVPELSGEIHRLLEYPDSASRFESGFGDCCNPFMPTISTRLGREAFFIQSDPRRDDLELLCVLSSVIAKPDNAQDVPDVVTAAGGMHTGRDRFRFMLSDCGCLYFLIDSRGNVYCDFQCY